jgi:hypothetical protein
MPVRSLTLAWRRLRATLAQAEAWSTPRSSWLEAMFIPLASLSLAWWLRPHDPFLTSTAFPWLWLAPVIVALRYGVTPGLAGVMLYLAAWLLAHFAGTPALVRAVFPRDYFFGGGLLVLLCGEFSGGWKDRFQRLDEANLYISERLSRLTKRHLLLNLSHDRLEQEMLARPGSLRDALTSLRDQVLQSERVTGTLPAVPALLTLLEQYVKIESATLYTASERADQLVLGVVAGTVGEPQALAEDDPLLMLALQERKLVHIAQKEVTYGRPSNQLVVAPLIASDDSLVGVLAVSGMPFFSLNVENLQMLSVMLAYYADRLQNAADLELCRRTLPDVPWTFAEELARMRRIQQQTGMSSQIVVMSFAGPSKEAIPPRLLQIKRGLDLYWQATVGGQPVLAILMPFSSPSGLEGYLHRIEEWLGVHFGGDFDSLQISLTRIDFAQTDPLQALAGVMGS